LLRRRRRFALRLARRLGHRGCTGGLLRLGDDLRRLLGRARRRSRTSRGGTARFGENGIDVLVRRRDHADDLTDGTRVALIHETLAQHALTARHELHDRLVGLDFREHVTVLDLLALVLEPLYQSALFHGRRERFHEYLGCHLTCGSWVAGRGSRRSDWLSVG
jgi:hypothetical protein